MAYTDLLPKPGIDYCTKLIIQLLVISQNRAKSDNQHKVSNQNQKGEVQVWLTQNLNIQLDNSSIL